MASGIVVNLLGLVGHTPLIRLNRLPREDWAVVLAKLENCNPSGSIKDRLVLAILEDAESKGRIKPGDTVVEASSGNTALSLAMIGRVKGYRVIMTMPESVSIERRRLISRFGAEIRLSRSEEGMAGARRAAELLLKSTPRCFILGQFDNPASARVHKETTAREILQATQGRVDAFVAGIGTGATITGVAEALKEKDPQVMIVGVEPARSPLLSEGWAGEHGIPGLGADFVPPILNRKIIDEIITVKDEDALKMMGILAKEEGLMVGVSSGASVHAALLIAQRLGKGKQVVTVLPDTGERYLFFPF